MRLALMNPRDTEERVSIPGKMMCAILYIFVEVPLDSQARALGGWWIFDPELMREK